jgi:outer membrane protein assembly factor BamE
LNLIGLINMHKLLTLLAFIATLLLVGCSLPEMPGVYRPDIQQGNVVTQKMVNQLEPHMSKSQVKFILGTPLLVDVFHQDRWDYLYSMEPGNEERTQERIALYFEDDRLVAIKGDYRPMSLADPLAGQEDIVHTVPDYKDRKGLLSKAMETVGLDSDKPPERVPMEQGELTEAGTEAVTAADVEATTQAAAASANQSDSPVEDNTVPTNESAVPTEGSTDQPPAEDSPTPTEESAAPVDAAPVEDIPVETSATPEVESTRNSVIVPLEESVTEPAPVDDLLETTDNPQSE